MAAQPARAASARVPVPPPPVVAVEVPSRPPAAPAPGAPRLPPRRRLRRRPQQWTAATSARGL
eukprot:1519559-Alexandrium_andersonii.AAC.1